MEKLLKWITETENVYFASHAGAVLVLAIASEALAPIWTTVTYPIILVLAAASFLWNYPVKQIKAHGLFSEQLIETRLLWLVLLGIIFEYVARGVVTENVLNAGMAIIALAASLAIIIIARSRLKDKLVEARGFK
ncbi:MAG: hypothetical protein AABW54_04670 [Candidatus Micrarchaeota archaeon]